LSAAQHRRASVAGSVDSIIDAPGWREASLGVVVGGESWGSSRLVDLVKESLLAMLGAVGDGLFGKVNADRV